MSKYYNTSIRNLANRLRKFSAILDQELVNAVMKRESFIIDCIREQLWSGLNGFNVDIVPHYAITTIQIKLKKGQPVDRVTLKDTGKFYNSLHLEYDSEGFFISSSNTKLQNILKDRYGKPILRLSNENQSVLLDIVRADLQKKLKSTIENG